MNRPTWQRIIYNIWPSIYRTINGILFFLLMIIRTGVKEAINQIKRL